MTAEEYFPRGGAEVNSPGTTNKRRSRRESRSNDKTLKRSAKKFQKYDSDGVWTRKLTLPLCQPGVLVVGCVRDVRNGRLYLELPGGFLAEAAFDEENLPSVEDCYQQGQILPCKILNNPNFSATQKSRINPIKVTLHPEEVNSGLLVSSLQAGMNIGCVVTSEEDKGFQMSVGIPSVKAFLPYSACQDKKLSVGQILIAKIVKGVEDETRSSAARVIRLSTEADKLSLSTESFSSVRKDQILPGMVFDVEVERLSPLGVLVSFGQFGLGGFVANQHLPLKLRKENSLDPGDRISVMVTYVEPNTTMIGLSAQRHLLNVAGNEKRTAFDGYKVGDVVKDATVTQLTSQDAVYFRISKDLTGIANRKQLQVRSKEADATVASVYPLGSEHTCRIVGFSLIDRILRVTTAKSVLKQKIVTVQDARPGQLLRAVKVESVKQSGIYVKVYDHLKGYIPLLHTADVPLTKPEKTVKVGKKMRCRVLYSDEERNRLVLTAKRTLVASDLPPVTEYAQSTVGSVTDGVVVSIRDNGVLVSLYGRTKGWVRRDQLKLAGIRWPKTELKLGQPVRVKVFSVDEENEKMQLSLLGAGKPSETLISLEDSGGISLMKNAEVQEVSSDGLRVTLIPDGVPAFLPKEHLTDLCSNELLNPLLKLCFETGDKIEVGVFSVAGSSVTVTAKPILLEAYRQGQILGRLEQLESGTLVYGVIENKHPQLGYFVELPGGLTGLAAYGNTDGGVDSSLQQGQTVIASVLNVDEAKQRFSLILRPRFCYPPLSSPSGMPIDMLKQALNHREMIRIASANSATKKLQLLSGLREGEILHSVIVETKTSEGFICDLGIGAGLKGIVTQDNVGKDCHADCGATLKATVLFVDYEQECVELSVATDLVRKLERTSEKKTLKVGETAAAKVVLLKAEWVLVWIEKGLKFAYLPRKLHPNEAPEHYRIGRKIQVVIKESYGNHEHLVLSEKHETGLKEVQRRDGNDRKSKMVLQRQGKIKIGEVYSCRVVAMKLEDHSIEVDFAGGARGKIHASELKDSFEAEGDRPLVDFYQANNGNIVTVKCIGCWKSKGGTKFAECTVRTSKMNLVAVKKKLLGHQTSYRLGEEVAVFVSEVLKDRIQVSLNSLWSGTISQLHLSTKLAVARKPEKHFHPGEVYVARVLTRHKREHQLYLSLLSLKETDVELGKPCLARVLTNDIHDVRFQLPNEHSAVATWVDFSDDFDQVKVVKEKLTRGKCVKVCPVRSLGHIRKWGVSLRQSLLKKKLKLQSKDPFLETLEDVKKKQVVRGFVKEVSQKWIEVQFGAPPLMVGRVPISQAEKDCGEFSISELHIGSVVTVEIRRFAGSRIDLYLKGDKQERSGRKRKRLGDRTSSSDSTARDDTPKFSDVVDKIDQATGRKKVKVELDVLEGFDWEPQEFSMENLICVDLPVENGVDANSQDDTGDSESYVKSQKIGGFERDKVAEEILYQKELSLINQDATEASNPGDYDRLLFGSPNSSELWLRYMAYFVKEGKIDKARLVAERALNTIHHRETEELFNIWTGLLNLENHFGTADSLETAFERARKGNDDQLKVYKKLLRIYQNSGKTEEADCLCEEILKKFRGTDSDTWVTVGLHLMNTGRPERARELMHRALKSLLEKEHVPLLSRFAQMEYKCDNGDKERGKTIFENILSSYPKKLDVWSVYIDMTVKYGSIAEARPLFERVTGMKLGAHKMRFFFKKWMELEERLGSPDTQEAVKERALAFVNEAQKQLI